jgi:hypothetical protein
MRKFLIAASVAATLLAGQAIASDNYVDAGDRDSSTPATSNDLGGMGSETVLFLVAGAILIGFVVYETTNSQQPTSP